LDLRKQLPLKSICHKFSSSYRDAASRIYPHVNSVYSFFEWTTIRNRLFRLELSRDFVYVSELPHAYPTFEDQKIPKPIKIVALGNSSTKSKTKVRMLV